MSEKEGEDSVQQGLIASLENLIVGYEAILATKEISIDVLTTKTKAQEILIESHEKLAKLQNERIEMLSKHLIDAANWIKKRKAADSDGFIPDDDLC